jgi:hypothetical protein
MKTFADYKTKTRAEGILILDRILWRLLEADDCYYPGRGAGRIVDAELPNWEARETICHLLRTRAPKPEILAANTDDTFNDLLVPELQETIQEEICTTQNPIA